VRIGDVLLRFLETPGHTPESISVLVFDLSKSNEPMAVLTGDTLFIGDVGRPDLAGSGASGVELAGELYDSLHSKLLALPEHVRVFPAHGAGSLCGRNISGARSSTIGQERRFNYALRPMSREEFVRMMTVDLPEAPPYFRRDVELNRSGPAMLAHLPDPPGLSPAEVSTIMNQDYVLLDTRSSPSYGAGHIRGSLNVGLCGQFASWAGSLIRPDQPIILVVEDDGAVSEARTRLARVGLENVSGYLAGGIPAWDRAGLPLSTIDQISIDDLKSRLQEAGGLRVLDVRRLPEWKAGHISAAVHIPLHALQGQIGSVGRDEPLAVICAGGYRSSAATSILEQNGYTRVSNVIGGMSAWVASRYDVCT
jgi:rhodanese-related sulfurtransferase